MKELPPCLVLSHPFHQVCGQRPLAPERLADELTARLLAVFTILKRRPLLIVDQFDDYQARNRANFLDHVGNWITPVMLARANPFWDLVSTGLASDQLHLLVISRADTAAGLSCIRFLPTELVAVRTLTRVDTAYLHPLLVSLTEGHPDAPVVSHPEHGWLALRDGLERDLAHVLENAYIGAAQSLTNPDAISDAVAFLRGRIVHAESEERRSQLQYGLTLVLQNVKREADVRDAARFIREGIQAGLSDNAFPSYMEAYAVLAQRLDPVTAEAEARFLADCIERRSDMPDLHHCAQAFATVSKHARPDDMRRAAAAVRTRIHCNAAGMRKDPAP